MAIFENLEVPEGFKAELIKGEIVMTAGPDRVHNWIVESVQDQIPRGRWHRGQTKDLAIPGQLSEPQPLVVEVVSRTSADRGYRTERLMHAEGSIPAYLIVDPVEGVCVLLTEPSDATASGLPDYRTERTSRFGEPVPVDVLGVTLDTTEFQTYP